MTRTACTAGAAVILATLATAAAQDQDEPEGYQALVAEALVEFEGHRFEEARALFRQAHERSPSARTYRGIGIASFELRDYPEAYRALRAALEDPRRPLPDEPRRQVEDLLARTERFLGVFDVGGLPAGARLWVDGAPATLEADGTLLLGVGDHELRVQADGLEARVRRIRVQGGEREALTIERPPLGETRLAARVAPPRAASELAPARAPDPAPAIALLVAGGALAVASAVTGAAWWPARQGAVDYCDGLVGSVCGNYDDVVLARDGAAATTVSLGAVGLAGLVLGAVMLGHADARGSAARCHPGGGGIVCGGWL